MTGDERIFEILENPMPFLAKRIAGKLAGPIVDILKKRFCDGKTAVIIP